MHPRKKERIVGSFYELDRNFKRNEAKNCVIYLHGNSGSQLNAKEIIDVLLTLDICLFAFDFPGCGNSDGEYISLGHYEEEYALFMMEHIRKAKNVGSFALWGRSMGAVVALKLGMRKELGVKALILDSPFSSLRELSWELFTLHAASFRLVFKIVWKVLKKKIQQVHNFDLEALDLIKEMDTKQGRPPVIFLTGKEDNFVKHHHSQKLFDKYGDSTKSKEIFQIDGDHNSQRPLDVLSRVALFLLSKFKLKHAEAGDHVKKISKEGKEYCLCFFMRKDEAK